MLKRLLVAALVLPLFLALLLRQPALFRLGLLAALLLAYAEYCRILAPRGLRFGPWLGLAALLALLLPEAMGNPLFFTERLKLPAEAWALGLTAAVFLAVGLKAVLGGDAERGLPAALAELGGLAWLGLTGLALLALLRRQAPADMGPLWCLLAFWYAWIYDSGALFAGKALGRRPFNRLSPAKTWEGFWGGLLFSAALSALVLPHFFRLLQGLRGEPKDFPLGALELAALSLPASLLAQGGDLFESMVKRYGGVKDSSHLIPAQGGLLDKLDSTLFVAPLLYLVAAALGLL